jgi:hypothetical protein
MTARTNRGRALVAGTVLAASFITGFTAAQARPPGTQPVRPPVALEFWLEPDTVEAPGPVVAHGTGCADSAGTAGTVWVHISRASGPFVEAETLARPGGDWMVSLALPPHLAAGEYIVEADCHAAPEWVDEPDILYPAIKLTVTQPLTGPAPTVAPVPTTTPAPGGKPAQPVKATPHYTG